MLHIHFNILFFLPKSPLLSTSMIAYCLCYCYSHRCGHCVLYFFLLLLLLFVVIVAVLPPAVHALLAFVVVVNVVVDASNRFRVPGGRARLRY